MNTWYGIDVSVYQGKIDWAKVKAAGKSFVFVRAGWCGYDGTIKQDTMFHTNVQQATEAGLHVGVYLYSYASTAQAAAQAARKLLTLVQPYTLTFPIAFDLEDTMYTKMTRASNTLLARAFLQQIQQAGYYAMLYTYKYFAETYLHMDELAEFDVWIAQYAAKCTYGGAYGIWQYAGDTGRCDGVNGACDLNVAYKDYASIIQKKGLNRLKDDEKPGAQQEVARLRKRLEMALAALQQIRELADDWEVE